VLRLTQLSIFAAAAAMFMVPGAAKAGAVCGPGSHWVDTCAGGTYDFSSTSTIAVSLDLDRNGSLETTIPFLQFSGITQVFLGAGQNNSDPHSIQTELYNLYEVNPGTGATLRAGDGTPNDANDGPLYSPGSIVEQAGNPGLANSFFDVFFELTIPEIGGPPLVLTNHTAMQVECVGLATAPPQQCSYSFQNAPLDLYEGDVVRGELLPTPAGFAHHVVTPLITPEPGTMFLLGGALCCVAGLRRRKRS
jgi:hypothetical protein